MTDYRKLFDLTGKTAVVLGAASGIGNASAEALAALGADVMCADLAADGTEATAAGIRANGGLAESAICDASRASDVTALATTAIAPSITETALTQPITARPEIYNLYAGHTVLNRWSRPDEVATAVAYLASDAASYVSGSTLFVDGGWTGIDGPPTGLTQLAK